MLYAASSNLILVLEALFLTSEAFGTKNHVVHTFNIFILPNINQEQFSWK